jgi:hypothetical protein
MPLRVAALVSVIAVPALAPVEAQGAVVRPTSVTATTVVPAGGTRNVSLECPPSAVALNGAVTRKGAGVDVRGSIPGGDAGDWRFRLAAEGSGSRAVSMELRCVRLALPAGVSDARLEVRTRKPPRVEVPAGGSVAVRLRCGLPWAPTGYGFARGSSGDVRLAAAAPTAHGWNFQLENVGSVTGGAAVSARCLRQEVTARQGGASTELRFRFARPAQSNSVGPSRRSFTHSCRSSQFSLATGFNVEILDPIVLANAHPAGRRGGRWTFARARRGDRAASFLVCLGLRSRFE